MAGIGTGNVFLIAFRIMPFILTAYFVLASMFSGDANGLYVLGGIMIASALTISLSNFMDAGSLILKKFYPGEDSNDRNYQARIVEHTMRCNLITMQGNTILTHLPLSTSTLSFITFYFFGLVVRNNIFNKNSVLITMLFFLLGVEVIYSYNACANYYVFVPLVVGSIMGFLWAYSSKKYQMYLPGSKAQSKCKLEEAGNFKCQAYQGTNPVSLI